MTSPGLEPGPPLWEAGDQPPELNYSADFSQLGQELPSGDEWSGFVPDCCACCVAVVTNSRASHLILGNEERADLEWSLMALR
jgi:hypothetical protein